MNLFRFLAFAAALASGAALAQDKGGGAPAPASTATGKFGFVNTERILRDAVPAQRAQEDMEKNSVTMSETQRRAKEREFGDLNREFQRKQREFREDLNQRRNEELAQVVTQANQVIQQIAE